MTISKEITSFTNLHQKRNLVKTFILTVLYPVYSIIFVYFNATVKGALLIYIIRKTCVWSILYINFIDNILLFLANQTQEKSNASMTRSLRQATRETFPFHSRQLICIFVQQSVLFRFFSFSFSNERQTKSLAVILNFSYIISMISQTLSYCSCLFFLR